jgi:hypothetical protein
MRPRSRAAVVTAEVSLKRPFPGQGSTLKVHMNLSSFGRCASLHSFGAIFGTWLSCRCASDHWQGGGAGWGVLKKLRNTIIFNSNASRTLFSGQIFILFSKILISGLRAFFGRLGFPDDEIVALMGGHTLGKFTTLIGTYLNRRGHSFVDVDRAGLRAQTIQDSDG